VFGRQQSSSSSMQNGVRWPTASPLAGQGPSTAAGAAAAGKGVRYGDGDVVLQVGP
jgi:hypothetical protein